METPAAEIVAAVQRVIGDGSRELQKPPLRDYDVVLHCNFNNSLMVTCFERLVAKYTGAKHCIALSSGTAALQLALVAAGVRQGDEVICPSLTFAATANAIVHAGATPHFVDVNHQTLGIHPFKLRQYLGNSDGFEHFAGEGGYWFNKATGKRVSAIVPVHLLGIPCQINELSLTAAYYGLTVIEDAAEALGSWLPTGKHCGTIGKAGVLSFNANKIVTTGGGGAVITDDEEIASTIRHLAHQAKVKHPFLWEHDAVGFNYRMPSLCAAIGIPQMERLPQTLKAKEQLALRYASEFKAGVRFGNNWLNFILLDPRLVTRDKPYAARDSVLESLLAAGFEARAIFTPLHMLPHFKQCPRQPSLETSEDLFRRMICLPSTIGG